MVHRALFGSFERFMGILIEHYAGAFPVWLAPVQAVVVPVADRHNGYAATVAATCVRPGCGPRRTSAASRLARRLLEAERQKIPRILVVGDREMESGTVSVRRRGEGDVGARPLPELRDQLLADARMRS